MHRAGWPFILFAAAADALLFAFAGWPGWIGLPVVVWVLAFFRDPARVPPPGKNLIVSPADGRVLPVIRVAPPPELGLAEDPHWKISIFMSIFDVHVNRIPCSGMVEALAYRPGKFFNASFDKASVENERMSIRLRAEGAAGKSADIGVVQIAGLMARRIECGLKEGQNVCRGDRFGIIRFGSRLELFLPLDARVLVREGQSVKAGETAIAEFPS
ncbi:MAG TPA: phosphatidylserine decarboxylase [Rhizomicrobium sp.]|nr:phosphatidylserine decarboxylase [Rhizomicrobium sp.]